MRAPLHAAPETYSQFGDENSVDAEQRNQTRPPPPSWALVDAFDTTAASVAYAGTSAFLLEVLQ